ncbi:hypothetical protein VPNG_06103 [Cytospora leucostoma]|uniref:DNA polymerase delta subunit 3 n=1 Tax=Cytospora leucostoma TaxID=1230097 RepID=A0A423WX55_9PEZI|nr:hypothetical protein VPNG_06103 [Cytospora leucostoma]
MDDYKTYLAEQVLAEDKIITYRALSRVLKVNINVAKQMLYGFHAWQNDKRSGAVHATYMVYGVKSIAHANGRSQQEGDVEMTSSSPDVEGAAEEVPVITLSVVAEESLNEVLSQYETVTSIHVYSLGPHPVKDLQLLADVSKPFLDMPADDGSVDPPKPLGAIHNPYVRRRERRGLAQKPVAPPSKPSNAKPPAAKHVSATEPAPAAKTKEETKADQKASVKESTPVPSGANKPAPAPKRGASGGIMQSFAKAASMPKKQKTTSQTAASSAVEVSSTQALSDDGEDDSAPAPEPQHESEATRKSRKERQEELRRMMEEDSEDDQPEKEDTPMDEPEEEAPAPEPEKKEEPEPAEVISSTGNGRRRGKRRVMKKKTVMDDQGYLVTVQEQGWESFSEDEPAPLPKVKTQLASHPAKAKKPAPKGQGNIMSFFSKK